MHPILFRIPLPQTALPLFWVLLAAAGIMAIVAIWQLVTKSRAGAAIAGAIGAVLVGAAFYFKAETVQIGSLPIYSYGVMLGLSLVVGWYLTLGLAERDGLPKELMANNYVVTAIAAVIGSRILYILTNLNEFDSLRAMLDVRKGGLVAYGGFLGGFVGSLVYLRANRIPLLPWADVAVPSLASGLMITRVGCYLFGCDFGKPLEKTAPAWLQKLGTFPHWPEDLIANSVGSPAFKQHLDKGLVTLQDTASKPVHPTQIYESLVGAGLLATLLISRRHQRFRGQIFLLFTFGYGVCRFLLEMLRADDERGWMPPSLPEHILLPGALALFSIGYVIGISKMVENVTLRRVTQVLAFVPPVVLFLALRPESFGVAPTIQLSTSQAVALSTGVGAAIAFSIYYQAALAHPEAAMAIPLPAELTNPEEADKPASNVADEEDEDEDEEAPKPRAKKVAVGEEAVVVKPKKKAAKKAAPKAVVEEEDEDEDAGEAPTSISTKKAGEKGSSEPPAAAES